MPLASVNGVRLHYEVKGNGATVLLLHPIGLDLTWWQSLADALCSEFLVLSVDLRGHGQSEVIPPSRLEDVVADTHALLDTLRLAPVHVVGLSLGGMVAQLLALEYPNDVRSLVLAATASTFAPEQRELLIARGTKAERGGMQAIVQETLERWFTPAFLNTEVAARCRQRLLSNDVHCWAATWRAIAALDVVPRLKELHVPTLVVTGDMDASTPPSVAQRSAESIQGAILRILPGVSHLAAFEQPEHFNPLVHSFLHDLSF